MRRITKLLSKLGLSNKEMQIYLACYKFGSSSASTLARLTNIPRSSIYDYTEKLLKKGFLKINTIKGSHEFIALAPQDIQTLLIKKGQEFLHQADAVQGMLDEFAAIKVQDSAAVPISYAEGKEAYMLLIQKLQFSYSWSMFNVDLLIANNGQIDLKGVVDTTADKRICAQKIVEATPMGIEYALEMKKINAQVEVKLLPTGHRVESDYIMFEGLFYHVSYGQKLRIFEIHDDIFYKTQRMMFDMIRQQLPAI